MKSSPDRRGTWALVALWSLFIYATIFSGWFDPGAPAPFGSPASSYLDAAP